MRSWAPRFAGGTWPDRLLAGLGGAVGILLVGLIGQGVLRDHAAWPFLVAPMGASAVLVFAVPASPLAQPWPVIGGNTVSALVGVAAARWLPAPDLAAAVAVGGAILAMALLRCLHPPGGAAALTAVIGGPAVHGLGFLFPLVPVGLDALLLALAGIGFHRFTRHSYPHRAAAPPPAAAGDPAPHPEDFDRALADLGEDFDIARVDLDRLFRRVQHHARQRTAGLPARR